MNAVCHQAEIISSTQRLCETLATLAKISVNWHTRIHYSENDPGFCRVQGEIPLTGQQKALAEQRMEWLCGEVNDITDASLSVTAPLKRHLSLEFKDASLSVLIPHEDIPFLKRVVAENMGRLQFCHRALHIPPELRPHFL